MVQLTIYYLCILICLFSLLASGFRVGRLCWVGQRPVVLEAEGRPTNFNNGRIDKGLLCL